MGWCCELVEPRGFNMWPFHIHIQLYPTHVPTASPNVLLSTHPDQFDVAPQFFHLHVKTHQLQSRRTKEQKHAHFNSPDPSSLTTLLATKSRQYASSACPGRSVLILYVFKSYIYPLIIRKLQSIPRKENKNLEHATFASTNQQPTITTPRKPVHSAYMASKRSDEFARPAFPHAYAVISSSRRCPPTFQGQSEAGGRSITFIQLS